MAESPGFCGKYLCRFNYIKDYNFRNQICSAAVSVSNNIAEGFDRSSDADFSRFLYIAISSASETKSMCYLAKRLGYIDEVQTSDLLHLGDEVSRIIRGLIKSLVADKNR